MYFADLVKVDLDIAGNCEMESMQSMAVLVGRANNPRRARAEKETARRLGGGWGGGGEELEFCWSSFADEHSILPKSTRRNVKLSKFIFGFP